MVWLGAIYLKHEGGFEVVMRALNHYNRRLRSVASSPDVAQAGSTFGAILDMEAQKQAASLRPLAQKLRAGLVDNDALMSVRDDLDIISRALKCYKNDSIRAMEGSEYHAKLVKGNEQYRHDAKLVDDCLSRLAG